MYDDLSDLPITLPNRVVKTQLTVTIHAETMVTDGNGFVSTVSLFCKEILMWSSEVSELSPTSESILDCPVDGTKGNVGLQWTMLEGRVVVVGAALNLDGPDGSRFEGLSPLAVCPVP